METEIRIKVPEGMEIDEERSTFECIKFKPKKLTYDYISSIMSPKTHPVYTIRRHQSKCDTFRKLLEVAAYLNGDWEPDWDDTSQHKYLIVYNNKKKVFEINASYWVSVNGVYFYSEEKAKKAIEIIGEEELKKFFSNNTSYVL